MKDVKVFNEDVLSRQGYLYSNTGRLSSVVANKRLTDETVAMMDFRNKRVLDIACGDGAYTFEIFDRCGLSVMHGVDLAEEAIKIAKQRSGGRKIHFRTGNAEKLPYPSDSFDISHLRGCVHHADKPAEVLREALRVAPVMILLEPNGYNKILKLIEKFSPYHLRHKEKSYTGEILKRWIKDAGGEVRAEKYINLVPYFCPDLIVGLLKIMEPYMERAPFIRRFFCGTSIFIASRATGQKDQNGE